MPTYQERENLEAIAGRLRAAVPHADLLVVDDNSPDGTGDLADKLSEIDPHIQVLHRTEKPDWARLTSPDSAGPSNAAMTLWWRWTRTGRISLSSYRYCWPC